MATRRKHIILIHGRHFKPKKSVLTKNWKDALEHGITRDNTSSILKKYKDVKKTMVYYGDISNEFLRGKGKRYTESTDIIDRRKAIIALKDFSTKHFKDPQAKTIYNDLPGKTSMKEAIADAIGGVAALLGIGKHLISYVAPDMPHYWNSESEFGSQVRWRLTEPLAKALKNNDDVLLISHSLGTMISYDVLWKLSYYGEFQHIRDKKITQLITLGSPLGDETIKDNLKGSKVKGRRRYPHNIKAWDNFAAEDDYIAHDQDVKNDFKRMLPNKFNLCDSISDHRIYNFSLRGRNSKHPEGTSNPHHGAGYLVHPEVIKLIAQWL